MRRCKETIRPKCDTRARHLQFTCTHLETFWWFVCERQRIWQRRTIERVPPPWTDDPVLQAERFTNVYRHLDPGTIYVIDEILERPEPAVDRIFNVMLYRLIGRVETHRALGFQRVATFSGDHLWATLRAIQGRGDAPFTAAYMVSGYTSVGTRDKVENVARLFERLSRQFDSLIQRINVCHRLEQAHEALKSADGFGDFLAYQALVDLLYPLDCHEGRPLLTFSPDDWAKAGPGAKRGIRLLVGEQRGVDELSVMRWLRCNQDREFLRLGLNFPYLMNATGQPEPLSLADIQNCLCEYHKYVKIRDGTGRGRRKFVPLVAK
jgi:hypothetical protein